MRKIGISLLRRTARTGEKSSWPRRDPDISGILIQQNFLKIPTLALNRKKISVIPTVSAGWSFEGPKTEPWSIEGISPSLDIITSPLPNLSFYGTINPDFSEIESDSVQIEQNRIYDLYYNEKRPFFLAGNEWLKTSFNNLLYTRSINSPIYGIKGNLEKNKWVISILNTLDSSPSRSVSEATLKWENEIEDTMAMDSILRIRKGIGDGFLGISASDKSLFNGFYNRVLGTDGRIRINNTTSSDFSILGSSTTLENTPAISGLAGNANLNVDNDKIYGGLWVYGVSEDFRAENGFITNADTLNAGYWGKRKIYFDKGPITRLEIEPIWVSSAIRPSNMGLRAWWTGTSQYTVFSNTTALYAGYWLGSMVYQDIPLSYGQGSLSYGGQFTSNMNWWIWGSLGTGPYYETIEVGKYHDMGLSFNFTAKYFQLGTSATYEGMIAETNEQLYDAFIARFKVDAFASSLLWTRIIVDYQLNNNLTVAQWLTAWEYTPFKALYAGAKIDSESRWQIFSKAMWQF